MRTPSSGVFHFNGDHALSPSMWKGHQEVEKAADGPLVAALEHLRQLVKDDPEVTDAVQNLSKVRGRCPLMTEETVVSPHCPGCCSQFLTRSHAWEADVREKINLKTRQDHQGDLATPVVDDSTASWLVRRRLGCACSSFSCVAVLLCPTSCMLQEQLLAPWRNIQQEAKAGPFGSAADEFDAPSDDQSIHRSLSVASEYLVDDSLTCSKNPAAAVVGVTADGNVALVDKPAVHVANPLLDMLQNIALPGFDVEALDPYTNSQPLLCVCIHLISTYELVDVLGLDSAVLQRYLTAVEASYRAVPYHSALHAADVVVSAHRLLRTSENEVNLSAVELFSLIFACAGACTAGVRGDAAVCSNACV